SLPRGRLPPTVLDRPEAAGAFVDDAVAASSRTRVDSEDLHGKRLGGRADVPPPPPPRLLLLRRARPRVQPPLAPDALQLVATAVLEVDAGAGDELPDRARDEDLARRRVRRDARADMHGDSGHLCVDHLALPGVEARPELQSQIAHGCADRDGARDCPRRPV